VLARGSFSGLAPGVVLPGTGDAHTDGRCPPSPSPGGFTTARIVAVRPGAAGGVLVLLGRNEGCGILLDELALAADGTPGAPRRLTATAFSTDVDDVAMLDAEGPRPMLVAKTTSGRAMVARAVRGQPLGTPTAAPLPKGARLGAFGLLRDGALALAFSRTCARAERVSDVLLRPRNGPWRAPVRVSRCGGDEPVLVDGTGRAVFAQLGLGVVARSSAPIERYTGHSRGGRSQRSGR
jgi:hypothetical protein